MSGDLFNLYWILVSAGFFLIAVEIFIPGGILGSVGVVSILAAVVVGFNVFGPTGGLYSSFGLLFGGVIFFGLWVKYCPKSRLGKWFTLEEDGREYKSYDNHYQTYLHKSGVAQSDLRPAGIAIIDKQKVDVVSEAGFIPHGSPVKVIQVTGNRIVVRQIENTES
ncbi:MAG TPA: NfeD family protein [Kiritimatiellia bacterium]|nr:NfeD family protein [Kiritimatiellia bacterium]